MYEVWCNKQQEGERDEEKSHNRIAISRCHRTQLSVAARLVLLSVLAGTLGLAHLHQVSRIASSFGGVVTTVCEWPS